jgi:hypothetical protein
METKNRREDLDKQNQEKIREQAALFDCWVEKVEQPAGYNERYVQVHFNVSNASAQAFRNVDIWYSFRNTEVHPKRMHLGTVGPTAPPEFRKKTTELIPVPIEFNESTNLYPGAIVVSAWFLDSAGRFWHRYDDGRLVAESNRGNNVSFELL